MFTCSTTFELKVGRIRSECSLKCVPTRFTIVKYFCRVFLFCQLEDACFHVDGREYFRRDRTRIPVLCIIFVEVISRFECRTTLLLLYDTRRFSSDLSLLWSTFSSLRCPRKMRIFFTVILRAFVRETKKVIIFGVEGGGVCLRWRRHSRQPAFDESRWKNNSTLFLPRTRTLIWKKRPIIFLFSAGRGGKVGICGDKSLPCGKISFFQADEWSTPRLCGSKPKGSFCASLKSWDLKNGGKY